MFLFLWAIIRKFKVPCLFYKVMFTQDKWIGIYVCPDAILRNRGADLRVSVVFELHGIYLYSVEVNYSASLNFALYFHLYFNHFHLLSFEYKMK